MIIFLKRTRLFFFGKIGQLCLIDFSFSIGNFCYCGKFLRCLFCFMGPNVIIFFETKLHRHFSWGGYTRVGHNHLGHLCTRGSNENA